MSNAANEFPAFLRIGGQPRPTPIVSNLQQLRHGSKSLIGNVSTNPVLTADISSGLSCCQQTKSHFRDVSGWKHELAIMHTLTIDERSWDWSRTFVGTDLEWDAHQTAKQSHHSVEVMRSHDGARDVEWKNNLGFDMNHAVLVLECPFDAQKAAAGNNHAVALENVRGEDNVGDARFVFEGEKDKSLGGAGTLARDDATGDADKLTA